MLSCFTGDSMGGGYDEKRNRRQEVATGWWRIAAKTVIGPALVAVIPVTGYAVVTWRDDLRALGINFRDLVGDFEHVTEWQRSHDGLHKTFDVLYARERNQEAVTQYQVGECQKDLVKVTEEVGKLNSSLHKMQEEVAGGRK